MGNCLNIFNTINKQKSFIDNKCINHILHFNDKTDKQPIINISYTTVNGILEG
jgi:hypothetical protein